MQTQSNFMKFKEEIHGGAHFRMIFAKIESSPLFKFELGQYGIMNCLCALEGVDK
uniref:Uncharacterized protein n=1 Tax=Solanum tuberosum TaxID=4113 RepID=M0ZYH8_SOLTU